MAARITAFLVWALVAACAVFWGLRLTVSPSPVPIHAQPVSSSAALRGDVLRLFAAAPAASAPTSVATEPALASRFKLIGLIAPKSIDAGREQGVALLAIDGKPPRAYRVGARVDQALVLQSVAGRTAAIGPVRGAPAVQLELPVLPPPATGNLPTAAALLSGASLFPEPVLPAIQPVQSAINPASGLSGAAKDADNRR